jgi:hypothetical protein
VRMVVKNPQHEASTAEKYFDEQQVSGTQPEAGPGLDMFLGRFALLRH